MGLLWVGATKLGWGTSSPAWYLFIFCFGLIAALHRALVIYIIFFVFVF